MSAPAIIRKIPNTRNPWVATVNGKTYSYEAGTEQEVPAEIAHLIDAYWKKQEVDYPETGISFNDLRDRPFGEGTEVLFDQRVELSDAETALPYSLPISDGDLVVVTIDGFKYEVKATVDVTGFEVFVQSGSEENPDFVIVTSTQDDYPGTSIFVPNKASATVKIEKPFIHTIDHKFLTGVLLYADDNNYLYKSDVLSEENEVSMDEVLGYAKKGMTVVVTPYANGERTNYYYATTINKITYEEPNYAQVGVGGDSYYHSKERVVNSAPPV